MPVPPAGFAGLTPEELRALEGHERQHLEARLQSLRNIHTLLDAAMLQINQYLTVLASLGYVCTGAGVRGGSLELPAAWSCQRGPQPWSRAFLFGHPVMPVGSRHPCVGAAGSLGFLMPLFSRSRGPAWVSGGLVFIISRELTLNPAPLYFSVVRPFIIVSALAYHIHLSHMWSVPGKHCP